MFVFIAGDAYVGGMFKSMPFLVLLAVTTFALGAEY
jgi:hypothetical protein